MLDWLFVIGWDMNKTWWWILSMRRTRWLRCVTKKQNR